MAEAKPDERIKVEKPDAKKLESLRVKSWPIWSKEPSRFDWHYDDTETCFFLEGEVIVWTPKGRTEIKKGDLVTLPKDLSCTWEIKKAVRKHYRFGGV